MTIEALEETIQRLKARIEEIEEDTYRVKSEFSQGLLNREIFTTKQQIENINKQIKNIL